MRRFDQAILLGVVEVILILPILLTVSGYMMLPQDIPLWLAMFFGFGFLGFLLAPLVNRMHEMLSLAFLGIVSFSLFIVVYDVTIVGLAGGLIGCLTFVRGVQYSRSTWEDIISGTYLWYGVFFYFCASLLFMVMDQHKALLPVIYVFGSVNLLAAIIAGNTLHLRLESGFGNGPKKVSGAVRRHNDVYVGLFLLGVVILWATGIVRLIFTKIRDLLLYWLTNLASDREWTNPHQTPEEPDPFTFSPPQSMESNWLDILLTVLVYLLGSAAALILLIWLIRVIWFMAKKIIAAILAYWSRRGSKASDELGYEDEKNVILELNELKPKLRLWNRGLKVKWSQLTDNRQRIRYLYCVFVEGAVKKGLSYRKSDTPSETIRKMEKSLQHVVDQQTADLLKEEYNGARYGRSSPSDEAIETLREKYRTL